MKDVIGKLVAGFDEAKTPGAFWWSTDRGRLTFVCPCGCGDIGGVKTKGDGAWKWDGNEDAPTVTPSIMFLTGCKWHGYLTAGVFRSV